jgi:hypothetical protein
MHRNVTACLVAIGALVLGLPTVALAAPHPSPAAHASEVLAKTWDAELDASLCRALLDAHAARTRADCVTHYTLSVVRDLAPLDAAEVEASVLATNCNVTVSGSMWNWVWWSSVTQRFCVNGSYVYPAGAPDCSSWGVAWPSTLTITWCGGGSSGYTADGGENVTISSPAATYGAGLRVWLNAAYYHGVYCWNAHC